MLRAEKWTLWLAVSATIVAVGATACVFALAVHTMWAINAAERARPCGSVIVEPTSVPAAEPASMPAERSQLDVLWSAVCIVESGGAATAIGDSGNALGIAQIWKIMVDDCNRIVGHRRWTYDDRLSPVESREMFEVYLNHYGRNATMEQQARMWNGGPKGYRKASTLAYWRRIQAAQKPQESSEPPKREPQAVGACMGL